MFELRAELTSAERHIAEKSDENSQLSTQLKSLQVQLGSREESLAEFERRHTELEQSLAELKRNSVSPGEQAALIEQVGVTNIYVEFWIANKLFNKHNN